jgi:hypothetical protein
MPPSPKTQNKRDFPGRRWLSIALRSLHLVGVVLVGAALLGGGERTAAGLLMLLTGVGLYAIELWCNPKHLGELAGVFIPVKLLLVVAMLLAPGAAALLFWGLLIASSAVSHAPGNFRHIRIFN